MKIKKPKPSDNSAQSAPEATANAKKFSVKKAPAHAHLLSLHFLLHVFFKKLFFYRNNFIFIIFNFVIQTV